jgi:regulatory protein YycI of two-component signal transduction system YycFG
MNFSTQNNFIMNDGVVFRTNKDGTVVVMKMNDDEVFYKIDGVAAEIFQRITVSESNLGLLAEDLSKEYEVSSQKIIDDAQDFLEKAISLDLISAR